MRKVSDEFRSVGSGVVDGKRRQKEIAYITEVKPKAEDDARPPNNIWRRD